jgi:two-component system CheB/CheR fusion protein
MDEIRLDHILTLIQEKRGLDFFDFHKPTLENRLLQFKHDNKIENNELLIQKLKKELVTLDRFIQGLYVSSTSFFRDIDSFTFLQTKISRLFKKNLERKELRVWVPGCSTGEEAYSLAILIKEECEKLKTKIFATDIDQGYLTRAKKGVFHKNFTSLVSASRQRQFFHDEGNQLKIKGFIKKIVIFSPHNLKSRPPLLDFDLISCRNVLMYFKREERNKILSNFYHGLKKEGILFLGQSEGDFPSPLIYEKSDPRYSIFQKTKDFSQKKNLPGE